MKTYVVLSLCLGLSLAVTARAADRPEPLPGQKHTVAEALKPCPGGLERFLPGNYYFCSAARHFWSGDYGLARESLKDAAVWANKPAQYALGIMYFNGDGTDRNRPLGLAWLALAAERHDPAYEPAFVSAFEEASADERAQANVYWKDLRQTYADRVAAPRAERRFDREYRQLAWAANFGGSIFVDGMTFPDALLSGQLGSQSAFSFARFLQTQKTVYFYGYDSHVFVGDAQLVPIGEIASRTQKSSPGQPAGE